jgi:hypothetical protein
MEHVASLPVIVKTTGSNGHRQSSRCHFRLGVCAAALRAVTAGQVYLTKDISLEEVAARHGSNVQYVRAAITLLKSGDQRLIEAVMRGDTPILTAAKAVVPLVMLLTGYEQASPKARDDFFAATGCTNDLGKHLAASSAAERTEGAVRFGDAEVIWNEMVLPLVRAAE